jgi:hypothetical protein
MIAGHKVKLSFIALEDTLGQYRHDQRRIEIDKLLCDQGRVDTIRHEMMEASLLLTGIGFAEKYDQEPIVRCMEEIFFPAWKSFLKTIKWIDA